MLCKRVLAGLAVCLLAYAPLLQAAGKDAAAPVAAAAPVPATEAAKAAPVDTLSLSVDKTTLDNGGTITITGKAAPGKPVFIEVFNENPVRGSFFDNKPDKDGKVPYRLYLASEIPAFYRILVPKSAQPVLDKYKKDGKGWAYSAALKETGGDMVYSEPGKRSIDAFQATLVATMSGSRGDQLPVLADKERERRSMQIVKGRFRSVDKLLTASIEQKEDGSFTAQLKIPDGAAPGKYFIRAATDKNVQSVPVSVENHISLPMRYMSNAGTSLNIFWPFLITLALATFGVLMGAGGGFIINPIMLMMFPIPHNVVAGTVTQKTFFVQRSDIASQQPAVTNRLGRCLRILPVAQHHMRAASQDLTIVGDADFDIFNHATDCSDAIRLARIERNHRRTFRQPVAFQQRQSGRKECLANVPWQRRTAGSQLLDPRSEQALQLRHTLFGG